MTVGILHPGAMGAAVGAQLGSRAIWASEDRSEDTKRRAKSSHLEDVVSVAELVGRSDLVISICPPSASLAVARSVAAQHFKGIYLDANATSPATARHMSDLFERFVDGGIVGPPPVSAGTTRLYLSGSEAATAAGVFAGSHLEAHVIGDSAGPASALKMAYAGWTKGSSALLLAVLAMAEAEGVRAELVVEWAMSQPHLVSRSEEMVSPVAAKAWRFTGEMKEIADTFADGDVPDGFHRAAEQVYSRLADLSREGVEATLDELVDRVLNRNNRHSDPGP